MYLVSLLEDELLSVLCPSHLTPIPTAQAVPVPTVHPTQEQGDHDTAL